MSTANEMTHQLIGDYIEKVDALVEPDYGDFKRKVGQYLLRLEQSLRGQPGAETSLRILANIRQQVVYAPVGQVETARRIALDGLQDIRNKLH